MTRYLLPIAMALLSLCLPQPALAQDKVVETDHQRIEAVANLIGASLSQDPRVANTASPMVQLRYSRPLSPWLSMGGGLGLIIFPEHVPQVNLAARLQPLAAMKGSLAADLYLRPSLHSLVSIDGFDGGPELEFGFAPLIRGVTPIVGAGAAYFTRNARLVLEARLGVGAAF